MSTAAEQIFEDASRRGITVWEAVTDAVETTRVRYAYLRGAGPEGDVEEAEGWLCDDGSLVFRVNELWDFARPAGEGRWVGESGLVLEED